MARSLNRVQLIGNLTRDPELRYTPQGTAVCSFSIATNRNWTTDTGEKKEEVEFHRIVAWNKLAELCSQFLVKGRKVFVEGRLTTRSWTAQDGNQKQTTEIVISDMILLDSKRPDAPNQASESPEPEHSEKEEEKTPAKQSSKNKKEERAEEPKESPQEEEIVPDDIPF
ncbi:MAG: single-stranded DNA-binding protein [Patescibacteria group bacterium]|nr:single-stranded DNA-binding protein [Patescibacteria group bacterium]